MTVVDQTGPVKMRILAGRALAVLVTIAFIGSALTKLAHVTKVVEGLTQAGIPDGAIVPIGILELSCLTLYLVPSTSIFGTFLLTGYIGGAIVTQIIGRQTLLPPLLVGVLMFTSAYLRHTELRDSVPFRSSRAITPKASRVAATSHV